MTTIAFKHGVMAADSRATTEDGRHIRCEKLYRVVAAGTPALVGLAGGSFDGLAFLDWLVGEDDKPPQRLIDGEADFWAMVYNKNGLFLYDKWCRPDKVLDSVFAIGSGSKAALGAMHAGADAARAVEIACKIDVYSALPIVSMSLKPQRKR